MFHLKKSITLIALVSCSNSFALSTTDLTQGVTPENLIAEFIDTSNSGVTFTNLQYHGANSAIGLFKDGINDGLGIEQGIMLSSGRISNAIGPNKCYKTTTVYKLPGDKSLDALGGSTYDAAVLEFDFVPDGDSLEFNYVFASEEYIEWTGSKFNDVFGFFLDGQNIALIPNTTTPVAINSVHSTPWSEANPSLYRDNNYPFPWTIKEYNKAACQAGTETPFKTEFDGFTTVLTASATVIPDQTYHLKLVVADRGDYSLDSAVFIQGKSFTTVKNTKKKRCKLHAVHDEGLNDSQLFVVDIETQTVTTGPQYLEYDLEAFDAAPVENSLYAASGKDSEFGPGIIFQIDLQGQLTSLGHIDFENNSQITDISGLSFNPDTGILWGWAQKQGLFRLDVDNLPNAKAQLKWPSTITVEDLSWNLNSTALYLAQQHNILRYDGINVEQFCALPNGAKIEALETTDEDALLLAIDGDDVVYELDLAQTTQGGDCVIEPAPNIPATSYEDMEGMAWVCIYE
jgi:hypothetical protein